MLEWRLERERGTQFVDWKIAVLDLLWRYLLNRESSAERDEICTLGTTSFFHLWEEACKTAFGDALSTKLGGLNLSLKGEWAERKCDTLLGIIESPKWERRLDSAYIECGPVATLIPDTISFAVGRDGRRAFCIYDAKYYAPSLGGKMEGQPGLQSVTKQFLYQSAYKGFVLDHEFDYVVNAFWYRPQVISRSSWRGSRSRKSWVRWSRRSATTSICGRCRLARCSTLTCGARELMLGP